MVAGRVGRRRVRVQPFSPESETESQVDVNRNDDVWRRVPLYNPLESLLVAADRPEHGVAIKGVPLKPHGRNYMTTGGVVQTEYVNSKGRKQVRFQPRYEAEIPRCVIVPASPGNAVIVDRVTGERSGLMTVEQAMRWV